MHINKNKKSCDHNCIKKKENLIDEIQELQEKIKKQLKEEIKSLEERHCQEGLWDVDDTFPS